MVILKHKFSKLSSPQELLLLLQDDSEFAKFYLHALAAAASMHLLTIKRSSARGRRLSQLWSTAIESARFFNMTSERKASVLDTKLFSPNDSVISRYSAAHLNTATLEGVISKLMP
jgi:hypothetical protein